MSGLGSNPKIIRLARELGLPARGDCLPRIRDYALARVAEMLTQFPVGDLDTLRRFIANKFRVKIEQITRDADVERIAAEYRGFHPALRERLRLEFHAGRTEGITLERDGHDPVQFRYLVVVDARGERSVRAYFTAWHELAHFLVHPPQLAFPGFRRVLPGAELDKDPVEAVVDDVAGRLAFYPPLYEPLIAQAIKNTGGFSFRAIEVARESAAPSASVFASAIGSLPYAPRPTLLVSVDMALKKSEVRSIASGQKSFDFAQASATAKLRVVSAAPNELAQASRLAVRRYMRVPERSVLTRAYEAGSDAELEQMEDQNWWETSDSGPLPAQPVRVNALRRGRFVYGLIAAL